MGWDNERVLYCCERRQFYSHKRVALLPFPCWGVCCQLQNIAPLVTNNFFYKEDNYSKATKNNEEEQWLGSEKTTSCLCRNHRNIDRNHVTPPLGIMHHLADMKQDLHLCLLFFGLIRDLARSSLTSVEK